MADRKKAGGLVGRLRDTAQIKQTLPDWLRREVIEAADEIERLHTGIAQCLQMLLTEPNTLVATATAARTGVASDGDPPRERGLPVLGWGCSVGCHGG